MADMLEPWWPASPEQMWILAVSVITNVSCALVGCYLVLRRMSLLGDALAHAVLPGLVVAFIFSGSLAIGWMFAGALVVGMLTTTLTHTLHRRGGIAADASMGIVFTSLFAIGVILIKRYAYGIHLDADCVFQGQLSIMPFGQRVSLLGWEVPRAFASTAPTLLVNAAFILVFWKELKLTSFDPALASALGFRASWIEYALMALVAATTVGSFEAVGSILVVAMLIVPGATAHLLCDRLASMLLVAVGLAVATAYLGLAAATYFDVKPAGMMAVVAGFFYFTAVFASPRYGVLSTILRNRQMAGRISREDLLAMLYRLEELATGKRLSPAQAVEAVGGGRTASRALRGLTSEGQLTGSQGQLELTDEGRRAAATLVRSHRLWEVYLVRFLGLPLDHVHAPAERMEHFIDAKLATDIAERVGEPAVDPHGRSIPEVIAPQAPLSHRERAG